TERADTYQQCLVVRRNFTELRIEVFQRHSLLFKDFEEAREGRLGDAELRSQTSKLLGRYPLSLRNSKIQVAGGDVKSCTTRRAGSLMKAPRGGQQRRERA